MFITHTCLFGPKTGLLGLVAFVLLLLTPIRIAFRTAWQNRKDPRGDLMLGIGVCLVAVVIHCFYEWIFVVYPVQVLFAIDTGIVAGLARKIALEKGLRARSLKDRMSCSTPPQAGGEVA